MMIIIESNDDSSTAGFITWHRLATSLFREGGELSPAEKITRFEVSERGINYFVGPVQESQP